jgi:hypothetical protein
MKLRKPRTMSRAEPGEEGMDGMVEWWNGGKRDARPVF